MVPIAKPERRSFTDLSGTLQHTCYLAISPTKHKISTKSKWPGVKNGILLLTGAYWRVPDVIFGFYGSGLTYWSVFRASLRQT